MEIRARAIIALLLLEEEEDNEDEEVERKYWVQPCLAKREQLGAFHTIFQEIRNDPRRCRDYIRMQNDFMNSSLFSQVFSRKTFTPNDKTKERK